MRSLFEHRVGSSTQKGSTALEEAVVDVLQSQQYRRVLIVVVLRPESQEISHVAEVSLSWELKTGFAMLSKSLVRSYSN